MTATPDGRALVAIGCEEGVWIGLRHDPHSLRKVLHVKAVSNIAVLEEFGIFLVLQDRVSLNTCRKDRAYVSSRVYSPIISRHSSLPPLHHRSALRLNASVQARISRSLPSADYQAEHWCCT